MPCWLKDVLFYVTSKPISCTQAYFIWRAGDCMIERNIIKKFQVS